MLSYEPEHMVVDADGVPLVEESGDAPEDEGKHAAKESSSKIHKFIMQKGFKGGQEAFLLNSVAPAASHFHFSLLIPTFA